MGVKCTVKSCILICISLMISDVEHLHVFIGRLYIIFGEISVLVLCPFFIELGFFFVCQVVEFLNIF